MAAATNCYRQSQATCDVREERGDERTSKTGSLEVAHFVCLSPVTLTK
jgi:hypothetical protein